MKYKCLVLDHDDTAVRSTAELHYPSFCEIMETMRPSHPSYSLEEFMKVCFEPGFGPFCRDILGFDGEEMKVEYQLWKNHVQGKTPHFYHGFLDIVAEFQQRGGIVCVVSHSESQEILRHYAENEIKLELVFGWEYPEHQRKPYAYPMEQILKTFGLAPSEAVMVDDLKLGYDMAKACGVDFIAAGWSHTIEEIAEFMKTNSDYYCSEVAQLRSLLFQE